MTDGAGILAQGRDVWARFLWSAWTEGRWEELGREEAEYGQRHLVEHLLDAGFPPPDLYSLLTDGWVRAWARVDDSLAGLLEDLDRIERVATREGRPSQEDGWVDPAHLIALFTTVLARSSVVAQFDGLPADLLSAGLRQRCLTPETAVRYADRVTRGEDRRRVVSALARDLPDMWRGRLEELAADTADPFHRVQALAEVAKEEGDPGRAGRIGARALRGWARTPGRTDFELTKVIALLTEVLDVDGVATVYELIDAVEDDVVKGQAVTAVLPATSDGLRGQARKTVGSILYRQSRWSAGIAYLARFGASDDRDLLDELVSEADQMPLRTVAALVPVVDEERRKPIVVGFIDMVRSGDPWAPSSVQVSDLAPMLPHVPDSLWPAFWQAFTHAGRGPSRQRDALYLVDHAPLAIVAEGVAMAWSLPREGRHQHPRARALAAVARYVVPHRRGRLLDEILAVSPPGRRVGHLAGALSFLDGFERERATDAAVSDVVAMSDDPVGQMRALRALVQAGLAGIVPLRRILDGGVSACTVAAALGDRAGRLPGDLLASLLDAVVEEGPVRFRTDAWCNLLPQLPTSLRARALDAVRGITDPRERGRVLAAFPARGPDDVPMPDMTEAFAATLTELRAIDDRDERESLVHAIRSARLTRDPPRPAEGEAEPVLGPRQARRELARIRTLPPPELSREAVALAPRLPPDLAGALMDVVDTLPPDATWLEAVRGVAPWLPPAERQEAYNSAYWFARTALETHITWADFTPLLRELPGELRERARRDFQREARGIGRHDSAVAKLEALTDVAGSLPDDLAPDFFERTLRLALSVAHDEDMAPELRRIAEGLPLAVTPDALEIVATAVAADPSRHRPALESLQPLGPRLLDLRSRDPEAAWAYLEASLRALRGLPRPVLAGYLEILLPLWLSFATPEDEVALRAALEERVERIAGIWP